jgi:hypothetical protein
MRELHKDILDASPKKRPHEAAIERLRGPGPFDDSIEYRLAELRHLDSELESGPSYTGKQRRRRGNVEALWSAGAWGLLGSKAAVRNPKSSLPAPADRKRNRTLS